MKRKYLVPGLVGLIVGLFLGSTLSYFAPGLGAQLSKTGFTDNTRSNTRCPVQNPNEKWSKTTHAYCQRTPWWTQPSRCRRKPNQILCDRIPSWAHQPTWCRPLDLTKPPCVPPNIYFCNYTACTGRSDPSPNGFARDLYGVPGNFAKDPKSDLYFGSCGKVNACAQAAQFNMSTVIIGTVFHDLNKNGKQDWPAELGIPNRRVTLKADWGTSNFDLIRGTDAAGQFRFITLSNVESVKLDANGKWPDIHLRNRNDFLQAGQYRLSHEVSDGFIKTTDDSVFGYWGPGGGPPSSFGIYKGSVSNPSQAPPPQAPPPPATGGFTISGYVYLDRNRNGIKDAGEGGLADRTTVNLTIDGTTTVVAIAPTNSTGQYTLSNVRAGSYRLSHSIPRANPLLPGGYVRTTDDSFTLTVSANVSHNFGVDNRFFYEPIGR